MTRKLALRHGEKKKAQGLSGMEGKVIAQLLGVKKQKSRR